MISENTQGGLCPHAAHIRGGWVAGGNKQISKVSWKKIIEEDKLQGACGDGRAFGWNEEGRSRPGLTQTPEDTGR